MAVIIQFEWPGLTQQQFDEAARLAEARVGTLASVGSYTPPSLAGDFKGSGVGPSPAYSFTAQDPDGFKITISQASEQ